MLELDQGFICILLAEGDGEHIPESSFDFRGPSGWDLFRQCFSFFTDRGVFSIHGFPPEMRLLHRSHRRRHKKDTEHYYFGSDMRRPRRIHNTYLSILSSDCRNYIFI